MRYNWLIGRSVAVLLFSSTLVLGQRTAQSGSTSIAQDTNGSTCSYSDLPSGQRLRDRLGDDELSRLEKAGSISDPTELPSYFGDVAAFTHQTTDRYERAAGSFSVLLAGWNDAFDGNARNALGLIMEDLKDHGPIDTLVIPLARMAEISAVRERKDISAVALRALSEINPRLANFMCGSLQVPSIQLLPSKIESDNFIIFGIKSTKIYTKNYSPFVMIKGGEKPRSIEDAVSYFSMDGSSRVEKASDKSSSAMDGADVADARLKCRLTCNDKATWDSIKTATKETLINVIPDMMKNVGQHGDEGAASPIQSMMLTAEKAAEKADEKASEEQAKCEKNCDDEGQKEKEKDQKPNEENSVPVPKLSSNAKRADDSLDPDGRTTEIPRPTFNDPVIDNPEPPRGQFGGAPKGSIDCLSPGPHPFDPSPFGGDGCPNPLVDRIPPGAIDLLEKLQSGPIFKQSP
jgi:hypothetical protein